MRSSASPLKSIITSPMRLVCALLFVGFTYCWLYYFQADMLAVAQHGLSGGKTHYDRTVGALICTGVLFVLHLVVYAFTRLSRRTHALTYLPSFLLLAFISSVSFPFKWGAWLWAAPLVLVVWVVAVVLARKILPFDNDSRQPTGLFSRRVWLNLLQMGAMMLAVAAISDTHAVRHFKAHAEVALSQGLTDEVLRVGERSHETDESLTMLRIFALSQKSELPERLFSYAVAGSSRDMLPLMGSNSRLQLLADTVLWDYFGARPDSIVRHAEEQGAIAGIFGGKLSVGQYLDSLAADTALLARDTLRVRHPSVDYRLMGYLIDRQLDTFAVRLPRHYALNPDSLPRHYREALVLYQQRDTLFPYADSLMLRRWHAFHRYDSLYADKRERRVRIDSDFFDTYWYYFFK